MIPSEQSTTIGMITAPDPAPVRIRGFAAALLLASLLTGAATVLGDAPLAARIAAAILTLATWVAGAGVIGQQVKRLWWVVLPAVAGLAIFVVYAQPSAPWAPHSLYVAGLLAFGAVAVAGTLTA